MTLQDEAEAILKFFKDELGMFREGKEIHPGSSIDCFNAAKWMIENEIPSWKEVEWPGFFVKHIAQDHFQQHPESNLKSHTVGKIYRLKGDYLWDIRFHDVDKGSIIILTDVRGFEQDIQENNGIGIIILNALVISDEDDVCRKKIEELKGGPSEYELKRRMEGIRPRMRKKSFFLLYGIAYFISPEDIIGDTDTWLMSNFQKNMRNSDNKPRNAKYIIDMDNVPDEKIIVKSNFNMDPEDYKEFFTKK